MSVEGGVMYLAKIILCSIAALVVGGVLAMNIDIVKGLGDLVLLLYLGFSTVVGPGLTWFAMAKLLKVV